jgi:hypothetical protein
VHDADGGMCRTSVVLVKIVQIGVSLKCADLNSLTRNTKGQISNSNGKSGVTR